MSKILVDSSVWIDFLNNRDTPQVSLLENHLASSTVSSCPQIVQEVLQGLRSDADYLEAKEMLLSLEIFTAEPLYVAIDAAQLYRSLRKKGVTIRKSADCIIAWHAIRNNIKLLHNDSDFDLIAQHTELKLVALK
jgi:predicted nucleic acid-binding protein